MVIDVKEVSNIAEAAKYMKSGGSKAMSRAINEALVTGNKTFRQQIPTVYKVKQSDYKENSRLVKSSPNNLLKGRISIESRLLTIGKTAHFSMTPGTYKSQEGKKVSKRTTATATIKKGQKKSLKHAFVANPGKVGGTLLWERKDSGRISPIKSLSIPQMAENKKVYEEAMKEMQKRYEERLEHHMKRELDVK